MFDVGSKSKIYFFESVPTKNIEIGASMITKYGLMTHVFHFLYERDLAEMEDELIRQSPDREDSISVTPRFYLQQLYAVMEAEMNEVFRAHFSLNDHFSVKFVKSLSSKKKGMNTKYSSVKDSGDDIADDADIAEHIEMWMKQRNLDYDDIADRQKFFDDLLDEEVTAKEESKQNGNDSKQIEMHILLANEARTDKKHEAVPSQTVLEHQEEDDLLDMDMIGDVVDVMFGDDGDDSE